MLFFGTLVLASMGYGFISLLNGFVTPFTHPLIKTVAEKVNETAEKTRAAMKLSEDEPMFPDLHKFEYDGFIYFLTDRENAQLSSVLITIGLIANQTELPQYIKTGLLQQQKTLLQAQMDRIPPSRVQLLED